MDSDAFVRRILDSWKRVRPRDWSGLQKTLGEMFATQKKAIPGAERESGGPHVLLGGGFAIPPRIADGSHSAATAAEKSGPPKKQKKRAPLAELSTNAPAVAAPSSENLQLATPPPSTRKRPRTASFVLSDERDADDDDRDRDRDSRTCATPRRSSSRTCGAATPAERDTPSGRTPSRPAVPNPPAPPTHALPEAEKRHPPPSPVSPSRSVRRSRRPQHDFVLEIPASSNRLWLRPGTLSETARRGKAG